MSTVNLLFRYFWFICAGVVFLNTAIWRGRVNKLLSQGRISEDERDSFVRAIVFGLGVPCLALGVIALWARYPNPSCVRIPSFHDKASAASSLVVIAMWAAILRWVWIGPGADLLSRIGPVLLNLPMWSTTYSPRIVRLVVTALVLIAAVGGAASSQSPPDPRCSPPSAAG